MPIHALPQFEADMAEQDRQTYERLKPPSSIVAKFGSMGLIGEFPFSLDVKPGCGSKFVIKTHRGTEIGEMLTSTCPNSGCGKSISRKEMLEYIERSGGKDYPFFSMQGKVLRIATVEDLNQQTRIDGTKDKMLRHAREVSNRLKLPLKMVDAEPILGGEKVTFYFVSEERIDFRELVQELATEHQTRIEMRQVGSRDEARLTADYEKCGQHCCCKQFLKVLKPVSMKNAKIQKATLDPLKISGRCGRLMCCLRYEEQSYDDLRARLPKKRTRVSGEFGTGYVLDTQILTQLCLIQLDDKDERIAVALEELTILGPGGGPQQGGGGGGGQPQQQQKSKRNAEGAESAEGAEEEVVDGESAPSGDGAPVRDEGGTRPGREGGGQQSGSSQAAGQGPAQGQRPQEQRPQERQGSGKPNPQGGGQRPGGGGRPQWPGPPRPGQKPMGAGQGNPGAPGADRGQRGPGGSSGGPTGDRPEQPPHSSHAPQGPRGGQPPSQQRGPMNPPPGQRPPPPNAPRDEGGERDEIDDILSDMETDLGDHGGHGPRSRGPQGGGGGAAQGPGGPGGPGGEGRRRKRRRRRGGGGPGGDGGGGGGGPPAGPTGG